MRYEFITFSVIVLLAAIGISVTDPTLFLSSPLLSGSFAILFILVIWGYYDMFQTKKAIARNFPILGRGRYLMEDLRPKIYQYFIESDTNGTPISRIYRNVVYQRAKKQKDTTPFGTQLDVYGEGYEWMNHSIAAKDPHKLEQHPKVKVGSPQCKQPYDCSIFNVSAMSFGSLSSAAIRSLNGGAKIGGFAHNTGEGGISTHHMEMGGDLIWQVGTGYFGCRDKDGNFSPEFFKANSSIETVKMIEIKLSQGAKPGHGGILPAKKNTKEIAKIRNVAPGTAVISPPYHTAFNNPTGLLQFVKQLRELSGGKPIGIKLCIGKKSEFVSICKAMVETGIYLDFVAVDGGEGGTGAAPVEFSNSVGTPMREGLAFVYDTLLGFDLKKHVTIIVAGKILTGFDMFRAFALGADVCYSARGMMLALGCIQALECNKNNCPTGVATQDSELVAGLVVSDKKVRVANYHSETLESFVELLAAAGIKHPSEINRTLVNRRVSVLESRAYDEFYPYLEKGSLLSPPFQNGYERLMKLSSADKF
jgi:glutamate synthase domain-containing protein 2